MSRLSTEPTQIAGLKVLKRSPLGDSRGFLERMFCTDELSAQFHPRSVQQINRTLTQEKATIRGLHFQHPPNAELKIVSCLKGSVFDVAVDIRAGSPTFLKWYGRILSDSNRESLIIPEGFAHGFQTLTSDCELLYVHTAHYAPESEGGLNALDPKLRINWPLPPSNRSPRDEQHPILNDGYQGVLL